MFRDLYKQANDEIKGDRAILEKAFEQAAAPVKKQNNIIQYSFVGTAVAAVILIGAVFANPWIFTNKIDDYKKMPGVEVESEITVEENIGFENTTEAVAVTAAEITPPAENEVKTFTKSSNKKNVKTKKVEEVIPVDIDEDVKDDAPDEAWEESGDAAIAMAMVDDEAIGEKPAVFAWGRDRSSIEEYETETEEVYEDCPQAESDSAEEVTEEVTEAESCAVELFSYMQHLTTYVEGESGVVTVGFKNVESFEIANGNDAIKRAENECTVEYDETNVYYDPIELMWMVNFGVDGVCGGGQLVYMNKDGITTLIVYGE